ncbi:MAG: di-heme oxidoredictase family protein [Methylocystis sp.]|uniref:di-heme oxidoreductase family protein n=1 Tax=Methylocystis sp. TaxID=1911079 RepID=UPI003D13CE1F
MKRVGLLLCAIILGGAARYTASGPESEAFTRPIEGLDGEYAASFRKGGGIFRQAWVIGPSQDHPDFVGLGPLYNRLSCIACHVKNGRGVAPDSENGVARTMAARLSVEGKDAHGGPRVHPDYGAQLNPEGVAGVAGEGQAVVEYDEFDVAFPDGGKITLRRPTLSFRHLAYGPLGPGTKTSLRNAPPVFGLGLLEAVGEAEILSGKGRANFVFNVETGGTTLGRFGLKANQPSLRQQIANAFVEDIGITSSLFPAENCAETQSGCRRAASPPELTDAQLDAVVGYVRALAPPARRNLEDARVTDGEGLFHRIGCSDCHRDALHIADFPPQPALNGVEIHPYTDLLLHDMGDALADRREDFEAGPRDWRTPPLWGLGLAGKSGDGANFLHDGRARTPAEAILWHGGEAQAAADAFRRLPERQRDALLAFLNSL